MLIEIHRNDWPRLRDLFVGERHRSYAFNTLQSFIDWTNQGIPGVKLAILSLDDKWPEHGTYAAVNKTSPYFVFCETRTADLRRLYATLTEVNHVLTTHVAYYGFPQRLLTTVTQNCYNCGFLNTNLEGAYLFYIEKERAVQFKIELPVGFSMHSLSPLDSEHVVNSWPQHATGPVNNAWPLYPPGLDFYVRLLITCGDSVGIFDSNGHLVGWSLRSIVGTLGFVVVLPSYENFGFDLIIMQYMAKLMVQKNMEVTAYVDFNNIEMYNKLLWSGFYVIDTIYALEKTR